MVTERIAAAGERRRPAAAASADPHIGRAPGQLASVQAFVNTRDIEQGTDDLTSPAALDRWLAAQDLSGLLLVPAGAADAGDLTLALDLRETLRAVLRSHVTGGRSRAIEAPGRPEAADDETADAAAAAAAHLAALAATLPVAVTADAQGSPRVVAGSSGSRGALAALLLIAAQARVLGTWPRLKVCSADDCEWAFYDRSPTRNGCWCSMQVCGSRAKSRAYRRRTARRPEVAEG